MFQSNEDLVSDGRQKPKQKYKVFFKYKIFARGPQAKVLPERIVERARRRPVTKYWPRYRFAPS